MQTKNCQARLEEEPALSLPLCVCVLCHDSGRDAGESDFGPGEAMQGTVFFSHNELGPELTAIISSCYMALMMTSNDSMLS